MDVDTSEEQPKSPIQAWGEKIKWENRVKSVCKPCWEIKYCPYGPLVEEFPLKKERDEKSCRIFGHDCPVFYVAEPLTETRELRRITRNIPRPIQFRVLKRDNQICRECGKNVQDEDIHFDHVIPWSKGGPSEEHNIRLLCTDCNRKKSNKYEDEYLVESFVDHVTEPVGFDFLEFLLNIGADSFEFRTDHGSLPDASVLAAWFEVDNITEAEEQMARIISDLAEFFASGAPSELSGNHFAALKSRWGFPEGRSLKVSEVVQRFPITEEGLLSAETALLRRLGWRLELSASDKKKWRRS